MTVTLPITTGETHLVPFSRSTPREGRAGSRRYRRAVRNDSRWSGADDPVPEPSERWLNSTHDWASRVDVPHLDEVRARPGSFAPGGAFHLILEAAAYAVDEARASGHGHLTIELHADGAIAVVDEGRGTDTRQDHQGRLIKKPVIATKDLRFFDHPEAESLPDGHPRRGMSVVAALSEWLLHTNRRRSGAWQQHYEYGIPVTDLQPVEPDGTTGTTVHFMPGQGLEGLTEAAIGDLQRLHWTPDLQVDVVDRGRSS